MASAEIDRFLSSDSPTCPKSVPTLSMLAVSEFADEEASALVFKSVSAPELLTGVPSTIASLAFASAAAALARVA